MIYPEELSANHFWIKTSSKKIWSNKIVIVASLGVVRNVFEILNILGFSTIQYTHTYVCMDRSIYIVGAFVFLQDQWKLQCAYVSFFLAIIFAQYLRIFHYRYTYSPSPSLSLSHSLVRWLARLLSHPFGCVENYMQLLNK